MNIYQYIFTGYCVDVIAVPGLQKTRDLLHHTESSANKRGISCGDAPSWACTLWTLSLWHGADQRGCPKICWFVVPCKSGLCCVHSGSTSHGTDAKKHGTCPDRQKHIIMSGNITNILALNI